MRWIIRGAVEQTGDEVVKEFEAATQAGAERLARRAGILWSSIDPVIEFPRANGLRADRTRAGGSQAAPSATESTPDTAPVIPYAEMAPQRPRGIGNFRIIAPPGRWVLNGVLSVLAVIGLLTVIAVGSAWWSVRPSPPAPAAPTLAPGGAGTAGQRPPAVARPRLSAERQTYSRLGREFTAAYRIRNDDVRPITIRGVMFNGEFRPAIAVEYSQSFAPDRSRWWPLTLTLGESVLVFHRDTQNRFEQNYPKDVMYLTVDTDRGEAVLVD